MRSLAILLLLLLPTPALAVDAARELAAAEDLALRGSGRAAATAYEELLERGVDFPTLRYNLGTLYLERADIGRAILHLRACLRAEPRNEDARFNLERAKAARADQLEENARRAVWQVLADNVSSREAALAVLVTTALLCLLLLGIGWTRERTRRTVTLAIVLMLVPWTAAGLALAARVTADSVVEGVVLEAEVPARKGPNEDAATSFVAHPGLYGSVQAEENGFVLLRLSSGLDAWLPSSSLGFLRD